MSADRDLIASWIEAEKDNFIAFLQGFVQAPIGAEYTAWSIWKSVAVVTNKVGRPATSSER